MISEIKSPHKAKVIISKNLAAQIQFMHSQCPLNKEWSALLVYQLLRGSITDLENVEIKAEGLYPMDYGDSTFTSFEGDENWFKCFQQYPQIDPITPQPGWFIGKIHDHPNFGVYHSGTDTSDLYSTAPKLPMFLSLIVNYATETDCKLAIAVEVEETIVSRVKYKMKGWAAKQNKMDRKRESKNTTYVMDCVVEYEQDEWMKEQCLLLKNKPKHIVTTYPSYNGVGYQSLGKQKEISTSKKMVRKFVLDKVADNLPDLMTLGAGANLSVKDAVDKTNNHVTVDERADYKEAVKIYFVDTWMNRYFFTMSTDDKEVLEAILVLLKLQNGWIVTALTETINELKTEHTELWKV